MRVFRSFALLSQLMCVALLALAGTLPAQTQAQETQPEGLIFLPLVTKSGSAPLAELVWQWSDASMSTGRRGIEVADWDGDGAREILVASDYTLVVMRHVGKYVFEQVWSAPMGVGWTLEPGAASNPSGARLWIVYENGQMTGYAPERFAPVASAVINLVAGDKIRQAQLVDLAGDGNECWLALIQRADYKFELRAYRKHGGAAFRSFPVEFDIPYSATPKPFFLTAQLDNDPQREVIMDYGAVIDPVASAIQWSYPDGFTRMAAGDIDGDGREELVHTQDYPFVLRAVDVERGSEKWRVSVIDSWDIYRTPAVLDLDGDGQPEVAQGETYQLTVRSGATGIWRWTVLGPAETNAITVGDINADGEPDLVWAAGGGSCHPGIVQTTPVSQRSPLFATRDYDGPFSVLPVAMEPGSPLNMAVFTVGTDNGCGKTTHFVVDSITGKPRPDLRLPVSDHYASSQFTSPPTVLLHNLDADPDMESVVGADEHFGKGALYLLDDDGSLINQRETEPPIKPEWVGDVDGDGQFEIVARSKYAVTVFNAAGLEIKWQSNAPCGGEVNDVAVGDIDNDATQEILITSHEECLHAINGRDHSVEWKRSGAQFGSVAVGEADGADGLEFAVIENARLTFYDGATHQVKARTLEAANNAVQELAFVTMIATPWQQLTLGTVQQVMLFRYPMHPNPGQTIDLGPLISGNTNRPNLVFADMDNDNHLDILLGTSSGVSRYRLFEAVSNPPEGQEDGGP